MQRSCTRCAHHVGLVARRTPSSPPLPLVARRGSAASAPPPTPRVLTRSLHARSAVPPTAPITSLSRSRPRHAVAAAASFATSSSSSSTPTASPIVCPAHPPPSPPPDFEPVEDDLPPGQSLTMALTPSAIRQILRAQRAASNPDLALRLAVESGGCHGYQYKMQVTAMREPDDYLFEAPAEGEGEGGEGAGATARLVVDAASLPLVKGSTIDYATELIGSAFKIRDNPQSKDAGCGCGVSWELKDLDL